MGWSATAPSPATWLSPSLAPLAKPSQRQMRRLAEASPPANATAQPAPAQRKTCIPPPECEWSFDKDGVAHSECTTPPHTARFWGIFCHDLIPPEVIPPQQGLVIISVLYLGVMSALFVWLVRAWAHAIFPGKSKWTMMCFIALALGLIVGLRSTIQVNEQLMSGSPPGLGDMCLPPPKCRWGLDKGGAEPVCDQWLLSGTQQAAPLLKPRVFGVVCPHQVHLYVMPYVMAASFYMIAAYYGFVVMMAMHLLALIVQPCCKRIQIPWTRLCCFAYVLGLLIGIALKTSVSIKTTATA